MRRLNQPSSSLMVSIWSFGSGIAALQRSIATNARPRGRGRLPK
jgi:hypothetical protein